MVKKCIVTLLIIFTLLFASVFLTASAFSDVSNDAWYYRAVSTLSGEGIINGFPDGTFCPDDVLTAAQFFKLVYSCAKPGEDISIQAGTSWGEAYFDALIELGLIEPLEMYVDELDDAISRYDAARVIARYMMKLSDDEILLLSGFSDYLIDYDDIPERYQEHVRVAFCAGIMGGYSDGAFRGKGSLTRAEASVIILRLIDRGERLDPSAAPKKTPANTTPENKGSFENCMFIGDSLTHGLSLYSGFHSPDYYYSTGITVFDAPSEKFETLSGTKYTLSEALSKKNYSKIYILLGINELGYGIDIYYDAYANLIDALKEQSPDSDIYLQSVLPVSESKDSESTVFTKKAVTAFNEAIQRLADDKQAYYVDVYSALADNDGFLPESATWDGVHLNVSYYVKWAEYIQNNT